MSLGHFMAVYKISLVMAGSRDAAELAIIDMIAHSEDKNWGCRSKFEFSNIIGSRNRRVILAAVDGDTVGYVHAILKGTAKKRYMWIEDIYVVKSFRRLDIARKLIDFATKSFEAKIDFVALLTFNRNVGIFRKLGFKRTMNYMSMDLQIDKK